jgi:hypothetical protein
VGPASTVPGPTGPLGPTGAKGGVTYRFSSAGDNEPYLVEGLAGNNPEITVVRGETAYLDMSGVSVLTNIAVRVATVGAEKTTFIPWAVNNSASTGINGNTAANIIVLNVPLDAASQYFYQDVSNESTFGLILVADKIGPTGPSGATGPAGVPDNTEYTPTVAATGLTTTSDPASGKYTRAGESIIVNIAIDCSNISNFGTGQYSVTFPVNPDGFSVATIPGILDVDGTGATLYHLFATSQSLGSAIADISYSTTNGLASPLTGAAPVTLTSNSRIYFNGAYVSAES